MNNLKNITEREGLYVVLAFLGISVLWYISVMLWQPTIGIMVDTDPYRPVMWVISLAALSVPFFMYLFSRHFRTLETDRKVLLFGLALLTSTIVHRLRCFIDTQFVFFLTTIVYFILDRNRTYRRPLWEYWIVPLYIVWNLITLAWTPDLHYGKKFAGNFLPMVTYPAMFLAFTLSVDERNEIMKLYWRIALMAVLLSFLSCIYEVTVIRHQVSELFHLQITMFKDNIFIDGVEQFPFNMLYAWNGMGHPSFNAIWAVAAAVTGFFLVKHCVISWVEFFFGEFVILLLQFIAQSRIGIVMVLIVFVLSTFYLLWQHRKVVYSLIAVGLLLVVAAFMLRPDFLYPYMNDVERNRLWNAAFDFIRIYPFTGTGLGGTMHEYVSSVIGYPWPGLCFDNIYAHNQFIGDWMQSGLVGFIFAVSMVILTFVMSIRRRSYSAFVFSVAILLLMLIEMPLRFLQGSTLIPFFLCLFLHKTPLSDNR